VADIISDGMTKVVWVNTIANINAPTVAELNGGLPLSPIMTPDGLQNFEASTADVDNSSIESTYDTTDIGRDSYSNPAARLKKQTVGADTVYTTLDRGVVGNVVVRRDIPATTAWASSQAVEVYPAKCKRRKRLAPTKNTETLYEVPFAFYTAPSPNAVVA
jgi:hypothetical protein